MWTQIIVVKGCPAELFCGPQDVNATRDELCPAQHPVRKLRGWRMRTIKTCGAASGIAVLVSCAWGMTRADRRLVGNAFAVVNDVKARVGNRAQA